MRLRTPSFTSPSFTVNIPFSKKNGSSFLLYLMRVFPVVMPRNCGVNIHMHIISLCIVPHQTYTFTCRSSKGEKKRKRDKSPDEQQSPSPRPLKKVKTDRDEDSEGSFVKLGPLKIVPDDVVKTFPYQSVGLLEYMKVNIYGVKRRSRSTAWVLDNSLGEHIIVTAAHCLKKGDEKAVGIQFTPGFIPHHDPPIFGKYKQIPGGEGVAWAVHPNWDPYDCLAEYDIGIVHLAKDPKSGKYVMSRSGCSFYKYSELPKATSGAPLIMANSSCGIQVGNVHKYGCAQSPYFNFTADDLVKLLFN